ncbi:Fasciclin arabinogalactan protein 3 [Spatholobus suberectus]|nr:Fasciclin arabinogalactan protein 3 [Spatholobus suberectus]
MEAMKMSTLYGWMLLIKCFIGVMPWCVSSFDITKLLSQYPAYSRFSNYLTQTELARAINARESVTVLAVDNSGMGPDLSMEMEQVKNLLSVHVALHYLDLHRLHANQTITLATLLETGGLLKISNGTVKFVSSADPNGVVRAKLIKPIIVSESRNNISVVQVNRLMMPLTLLSNPNALIPVPVISPVPIPVKSPLPVIAPAPTPDPLLSPSPVPLISPVPMPIITPVPVNPPAPVPEIAPVPVVSPVPVMTPIPAMSPVPVMGPAIPGSDGESDEPAAADLIPSDGGSTPAHNPKSGVLQFGVNLSLAILLIFSSIYINMLYH